MGVNQNDIALLRIGSVTAVKTSGIEIAVDSDKNEPSILYKGDIIDNVTTDSYVMIQRGYRKLVALVEEEYLTEDRQWRDDKYHRDADRYRRTLRASLQGELIDETFERGRTIMPMIGNTAYIATKRQVSAVYSPGTPPPTAPTDGPLPHTFEIGTLNSDRSVRFRLDISKFFASHIGIFGNTGSGKSYTLTQLYTQLFDRLFPEQTDSAEGRSKIPGSNLSNDIQAKFLIFDLNGEYSSDKTNSTLCRSDYKQVFSPKLPTTDTSSHTTTTHKTSTAAHKQTTDRAGDRIPISIEILNEPDFWFTVLEATEKTQRPFIERTLRSQAFEYNPGFPLSWLKKENLENILANLLASANPKDFDSTLVFSYLKDLHRLADRRHLGFHEALLELENKLIYNSTTKNFYFRCSVFEVSKSNNQSAPIYYSDPEFRQVVEAFFRRAFSDEVGTRLEAVDVVKSKFFVQFYNDVASGFSNITHLRPLIARLDHRSKMLKQCFQFVRTQGVSSHPVTIINLRYCSIEERKLIPLLVTRAAYKTQKDSFHSDRYLNIIIDEAHNLLSYESSQESETWRNTRLEMFEEVLKEGRKFGVFVTLASQRPHDISATITSQLHHYLLHQLVNPKDIDAVRRAVSYLDAKSFDELSSLPRGTCIISGTSIQIPAVVKIDELPEGRRPDNETIDLVKLWGLDSGPAGEDDSDSSVPTSTRAESAADADSTRTSDT